MRVTLFQLSGSALRQSWLWSTFLGLTAFLLMYPVHLRLESRVVWSPDVVSNLPVFGVGFYMWNAALLALTAGMRHDRVSAWSGLALMRIT